MTSRRQRRVSDLLHEEIGLIAQELSDPLLSAVTVTDVEVTADLRHAHVFVGQIGEEEEPADVMKALERAASFIRNELAERGVSRFVPQLSFHWDASADRGRRIDELLKEIGLA
jgi:ribosome-binding factor A